MTEKKVMTLEDCMASAARFKFRRDWRNNDAAASNAALRNGWLEKCCAHMELMYVEKTARPTFEQCKASAARFESRIDWHKADIATYNAAYRNGWLDECCAHMQNSGFWKNQ